MAPGMYHYVARARKGTLLFRTWEEGIRLFVMLRVAFRELIALCIMPDHIHILLPHGEGVRRLGAVMSGYARYRNGLRKQTGMQVWQEVPPPEHVEPDKEQRNIRYVHLNPCRKELVNDPLAWPLSTHRDFVGLSTNPGTLLHPNPERFHAYVSGDPSVDPAGTPLPEIQYQRFDFLAIRDAVSAVTRTLITPPPMGIVRSLLVRTAAAHRLLEPGGLGVAGLAAAVNLSPTHVYRTIEGTPSRNTPIRDRALAASVRVVGDTRFGPLLDGDLPRRLDWRAYRWQR